MKEEFVPIKTEFLKIVIAYISVITTLVLLNSFALMWYTKDLSSLSEIVISIVAWNTTILAFYTWKAKYDHQIGYRQGYYKSGMSVDEVIKMTTMNNKEED